MVIRKRNAAKGPSTTGFVVGEAAFDNISAVEGIRPSEAAMKRSADFDRRGLGDAERRREIIAAHIPEGKRVTDVPGV